MASMTVLTHDKFRPEVWSKRAQIARETKLQMANLVDRYDADVSQKGDVVRIPKVSNLSASDIGNDGSLSDSANTETDVTITVDQWRGCSFNLPDMLAAQSNNDLMSIYSSKIGYALGLDLEDKLFALATGFSQNVGSYNTDVTDANLRRAVQYLDDADAPFEDRHLMLKPATVNTILGIDKFVRYDSIPFAKDSSPIVKGNLGEIYGVSTHKSTRVYKTGNNTSNLMFHREAIGLAVQRNLKVEKFARTGFSDRMGGSQLFGYTELRDDHGVEVKS